MSHLNSVIWRNLDEGQAWIQAQVSGWRRPCVVLLEGAMGAGKTQAVKWIVKAISGNEATSPTFGIHHRYESLAGAIDHVDLYRLESDADLESTGFWDLFQAKGMVIVEWADRLPENVWPDSWQKIFLKISVNADGSRRCDFRV